MCFDEMDSDRLRKNLNRSLPNPGVSQSCCSCKKNSYMRAAPDTPAQRAGPSGAKSHDGLDAACLLAQQREHALRQLVGLRHHGGAGLLQDLRTRQISCLDGEVGVLDA